LIGLLRMLEKSGTRCLMPRGTLALFPYLLFDAAVLTLFLLRNPLAVCRQSLLLQHILFSVDDGYDLFWCLGLLHRVCFMLLVILRFIYSCLNLLSLVLLTNDAYKLVCKLLVLFLIDEETIINSCEDLNLAFD